LQSSLSFFSDLSLISQRPSCLSELQPGMRFL
jgi:hypothetical protein